MFSKTRFAFLLLIPVLAQADRTRDLRPNLIFIMADDLGYGNLGSYGQALIQTPELDRMAQEGLRFTRFYSGAPLCLPSRVSLMTGMHLGHTRVRENGGGGLHQPIQEEDIVISKVLQAAGYRTAMLGKWALGDHFLGCAEPENNTDGSGALYKYGWDLYLGEPNQTYNHDYYPPHIYRFDPGGLMGTVTPSNQLEVVLLADEAATPDIREDYTTDVYLQAALDFLDLPSNEPFFLYLPLQTPHAAFEVPDIEPYTTGRGWSADEQRFASMITRMDRGVGAILDKLKQLNLDTNTLVIFTSDNGGLSNFDSRFDNNGPLAGYKGDTKEGGLRVPCLAWWPGTIQTNRLSDEIRAFWDILPTFSSLAGIASPEPIDGISFVPTLLEQPGQGTHDYLFFLSGNNDAPELQSYYVVKGPSETRTDTEIYAAAFQQETSVSMFTPTLTVHNPNALYAPSDPLPAPSLSMQHSDSLELTLRAVDGVEYTLEQSSNLVQWAALDRAWVPTGLSTSAWTLVNDTPLLDQQYVRTQYAAYAPPALIPENLSMTDIVLLGTDFTAHETLGGLPSDSAPSWSNIAQITPPANLVVNQTAGAIGPRFFSGFLNEFAVDLNVTDESPWQLDIPFAAATSLSISQIKFTAQHYKNTGERKTSQAGSSYTVSFHSSTGALLETHTAEEAVSGASAEINFNSLTDLPSGTYILRIVGEPNSDGFGNNQGIDDLAILGSLR